MSKPVFTFSVLALFTFLTESKAVLPKREVPVVLSDCMTLDIKDCDKSTRDPKFNEPKYLNKPNRFETVLEVDVGCEDYSAEYRWTAAKYNTITDDNVTFWDADGNTFTLEPFTLEKGMWYMVVDLYVTRKETKEFLQADCLFELIVEPPVALIRGGSERLVESGIAFIVDGSESVDQSVPANVADNLKYRWTCRVIEGSMTDFCQKELERKSTLEVPARYAIKNYKYLFNLSVSDDLKTWSSTSQVVIVKDNVVVLEIICKKNCLPVAPVTDSSREIFLRSRCVQNCIDNISYIWTVEDVQDFDYDKSTQFGRRTDKFLIKPGILEPGKRYKIRVSLYGDRLGSAVVTLDTHEPPKIDSCQVKPSKGKSMETKFKISCKYTGTGSFFEIYTSKDNTDVLIAKSSGIDDLEFFLPSNPKTYIKIADEYASSDIFYLTVDVEPSGRQDEQKVSNLTNTFKSMLKKKSFEGAIQIVNGLIEEIESQPDLAQEVKTVILDSLETHSITDPDEAKQIAAVVTKLVNNPESESDPIQGEKVTRICKEVAKISLEQLQKQHYPQALAYDVKVGTKTLMGCGETDTKSNLVVLRPTPLPSLFTTPFPLLSIPSIKENYPDYDDDSVLDKKHKYEEASNNFVDICETNLKMMSLTVARGEDTEIASTDFCSVELTKTTGKEIAGKEIEGQGAIIRPSLDLKSADTVNVLVCSWRKDPFWWNPQGRVVSTSVILLKITKNEEEMHKFKDPNRISLDFSDAKKKIETYDIEEKNMSVIKVDVKKGEDFNVEISSINGTDSLFVLITDLTKPKENEVKKKGSEVKEAKKFPQKHDHDYDTWYYISIVPKQSKTKYKFKISVYSISCYSWNMKLKKWQFACKGVYNSTKRKLDCFCTHLSILAGIVHNNPIKIESIIFKPDFEMILIDSIHIFVCLAISFALYCIALSFIPFRKSNGMDLYLPADSSSSSLYVYLVRVRTGKRPSSGTTSNICMKIFGHRHNSRSHVMNYPDPYEKIFQWGNEDWFVLPTARYLGVLEKLSIWTDFSGRSPRWFCSDVTILDLQTNKKWFFKVNVWFDLPPNGQTHVAVTPSEEKEKKRFFGVTLIRLFPRRSHQDGFNFLTKSTILLSIILTIFSSCLVFYGMPRLRLNDGFVSVSEYEFNMSTVLIAFGASGVSYLIHIILIFLKRSYFCWTFLIVYLTLISTHLIIFGFWIPPIIGWLWMTSVAIALLFYFLIFENIYEMISNLFSRPKENLEWLSKLKIVLLEIEAQRRLLYKRFGEDLLRSYFTHLYRPLDAEEIKEKKMKQERKLKLITLLEDVMMFTCYITLLYLTIFANRNPLTVKNHDAILDTINGLHTSTDDATSINSIDTFYDYVNRTIISSLHAQHWYWKYVVDDPGITKDFQNKLLGVARLRQKRAKNHPCKVPLVMKFLFKNSTCRSEFRLSETDFDSFGNENSTVARLAEVWNYTAAKTAGLSVSVGKFGVYSGGGFIAPLGRTVYNSFVNLNYLRKNRWLDDSTRAVFVEFLVYNVNSNLFSAVKIMTEMSVTGYYRVRVEVKTTQLLFIKDEVKVAQIVIFASFTLIVFIFSVKLLWRLWKNRLFFLQDLWILIDLAIVGMSYGCFALFLHRAESVREFLDEMAKSKKNEFVNYFNMFHEDLTFVLVAALLVFFATIRLWKLCRFATVFRVMEKTIVLSTPSILVLIFNHVVLYMAFTFFAFVMFGGFVFQFKDVGDSLLSLFLFSLGLNQNFDPLILERDYPVHWGLFYVVFQLTSLWFVTIYVAVIMICYYQAGLMASNEYDFDNVKKFVVKEFKHCKTLTKVTVNRLLGGADSKKNRQYVIPKPDEDRYADCMTLESNKIEMMRCITWYTLLKYTLSEEETFELMRRFFLCFFKSGKKEKFFKYKNKNNLFTIIHDDRIEQMANTVQLILSSDVKNRKRQERARKKIINKQLRKFDYIKNLLITMLRIVDNIEIE